MSTTISQEKLADDDIIKRKDEISEIQQVPPSENLHFKTKAWNVIRGIKAEPIMALFGLGFYMPAVFIQNLAIDKLCMVEYPAEVCLNKSNKTIEGEIQEKAAQYLMIHYLVRQLPAVILSLFMGSWSDIYGRKFVMQVSLIGNILSFFLYLLNYYYMDWPAEYIILAGIPAGLTGDYAAFMLGIFGFIKDVHTTKELSTKISTTDGIEMLSSQIGPLIGAQLYTRFSYPSVFAICIVFHVLGMILVQIFVTDSSFKSSKWSDMARNFFRIQGFLDSLKSVVKKRDNQKRSYILGVLVTAMIIFFGYFGHSEIMFLYTRLKLSWDVNIISYYNIALGGCATIGPLILMPILLRYLQLSDITFGLIGHLGFMAFYLGTAFADDDLSMFLVCIFQIPATMSFVTLRSCISKCVSNNEVGRIMSMYAVLQALCRNLGQIISTQIYVATIHSFVGAFFLVAAALFVINISVYGWVFIDMKKRNFILNEQDTEGIAEATMGLDNIPHGVAET